jgi:tetratricopeptide (TPR) repeat protein
MMIPLYRLTGLFLLICALVSHSVAQTPSSYEAVIQQGKSQLQAGSAEQAAVSGKAAIKLSAERWEGYALVGGALMNLKQYEAAADELSKAIERAPAAKQPALRDLRRQCLLAESGSAAVAITPPPATTTSQAEIVLWKSIENSTNGTDFQTYLEQYPQGAFAALARRHLEEAKAQVDHAIASGECGSPRAPNPPPAGNTVTKEQMLVSRQELGRFNSETSAYLSCVKREMDSASTEEQKKTLEKMNNDAIDALQAAIASFSEQMRNYTASRWFH